MSDGTFIYGLLAYKNSLLFTKLPFSLFSKPTTSSSSPSITTKSKAKLNPTSLCDEPYSTTDAAILDLIQYYHLVNMCVSARVAKSEALMTDITYSAAPPAVQAVVAQPMVAETSTSSIVTTKPVPVQTAIPPRREHRDSSKQPSPRRIRRYLMRTDISLACFERSFLNELMLQHFESPFEDQPSSSSFSPSSSLAATSPSSLTSASTGPSKSTSISSASSVNSSKSDYDLDRSMIIELVKPAPLLQQGGSIKTRLSAILEKCAESMIAREHSRETRRESFWRRFFGEVL